MLLHWSKKCQCFRFNRKLTQLDSTCKLSSLQGETAQISFPVVFSLSHKCMIQGSARESGKVHIQNLGFSLPGSLVSRESLQTPTLQQSWLFWAPSLGSCSHKGGGIFNWSFSHRAHFPQSKIAKGETHLVLFSFWNAQTVFCYLTSFPFLFYFVVTHWRFCLLEAYPSHQK